MHDSDAAKTSRTTWFSLLREELTLIDDKDCVDPHGEVDEQVEVVHGIASLEERRLFTYALRLEEMSARLMVDARFCRGGQEERQRLLARAYEADVKAKVVREVLWADVMDEFGCWAPDRYVGLRSGFTVVSGRRTKEGT